MHFRVNPQVAKPQYVLLWCWAAAVGAGLLKSDDLIMSAARLRCSYDIQYETENLELLMDDATKVKLLIQLSGEISYHRLCCEKGGLNPSSCTVMLADVCFRGMLSETRKVKVTTHQSSH